MAYEELFTDLLRAEREDKIRCGYRPAEPPIV
jgi:hypothetical protein